MIAIKIQTDSDAFFGKGFDLETSRILKKIAREIESGGRPKYAMDINGNKVCTIEYLS
jgi:hypothetical protein